MPELSPCFDDRVPVPWPPGGPVPLDRASLLDLPLTDYARLRPHLRTGDLLFCSGRTLFARATRFATASPWSHVGILFRPVAVDRVLVLEAQQSPGVRPVCLSSFLDNYLHSGAPYPGRLLVVRHDALDQIDEAKRSTFFSWMVDELGRPYSLTRTAIIGVRQLVNLIGLRIAYRYRLNGVICSEVVATAYRRLGVHLDYNPRGFITPGDIAAAPGLSVLGRLR
jgi:hypothetical protein